jgi:hypothetical protein
MKDIRLVKLTLKDFQGGTFTLPADGEDVSCYGANAAGKTRLASAFSWLLFNKDSLGRSDFSIKNLDATGEAEHNLEHSVEAVLSVDGDHVRLRKALSENWTKKRGSAESTFTGHSTSYWIDGVPCQLKDYQGRVAELTGDEAVFRLLTSPTAFPALHWTKARAILLEVCGDMTDAQVIASDDDLAPLTGLLKTVKSSKAPFDDLRKVIAARRTEINKELTALPVRIDEVHRGLPDVSGLNRRGIEAEVVRLETLINGAKLRLQGIDTGGRIAELSKELAGINADIRSLEQKHYLAAMATVNRLERQMFEIEDGARQFERRTKSINSNVEADSRMLELVGTRIENLRAEWRKIDAETFQDTTSDVCAACGEPLPADRVEEARENALAGFNRKKAERLEEIDTKGRALAEEKARLTKNTAALQKQLLEIPTYEPSAIEGLISERDAVKQMAEDYSAVEGRAALLDKRTKAEAEIELQRAGVTINADKVKEEIKGLQDQFATTKADADKFVRRESGQKRIEDLKAQEKTLAAEFEKLEQELYLCDLFIKTKVALLTDRINGKFEITRFKLFSQNINGGIEPCCEIMVNGVGYNSGLNSAARVQGGCEIVKVLQRHYNLAAPMFCDNRESVTELPSMGCQVISLIVSPEDKVLRAETVHAPTRKAAGGLW